MRKLRINSRLALTNGKRILVKKLLGSGGQGQVFLAESDGKDVALKWYRKRPSDKFLENIQKNIQDGSPSPQFLWPEGLTRIAFGSCGYIMPLRPEGYHEFSDFLMAKVRFSSWDAVINAAENVCQAFKALHAQGLSYQDLNDGNFFIHPDTGNVRIADNDNVYPHGEESGILGKARYMAPEVVMGRKLPDTYSDRFSLAVILYMFFCCDHPFEGRNVLRYPCLTESIERRLFGEEILFVWNQDASNRPVQGVHNNSITFWNLLPKVLKDTFSTEFSKAKLFQPNSRITELQWLDVLSQVRSNLVDGEFADNVSDTPRLIISDTHSVLLRAGCFFSFDKTENPSGRVVMHPETHDLYIQNISMVEWQITTPSGKFIRIAPKGILPVKKGLRINNYLIALGKVQEFK